MTLRKIQLWFPSILSRLKLFYCSQLPHDDKIDDGGKTETVEFYNKTKTDVDVWDQNVYHYTTYRETSRWSLTVFLNILDLSEYNAFVSYKLQPLVVPGINMTSQAWFRFFCALGQQLIKPIMLSRAQYPNGLNVPIVQALEAFSVAIGPQKQVRVLDGPPQKKRCMVCPRSSDRKVRQQCKECNGNVFKEHSKTILICKDCFTT